MRVNSVGTIIEVKPKPTPVPKETIAKIETEPKVKKTKTVAENKEIVNVEDTTNEIKSPEDSGKTMITIEKNAEEITDNTETEREISTEPQNDISAKITIAQESVAKNTVLKNRKKKMIRKSRKI